MKKLALLLLFTGSLQLFAITNGQVKISVRDAPLEKVFDIIKRQAGMHVFYQQKDIAAARKVTIHLENASVATVLDKALEGQELTYAIDGKNVFIKKVKIAEPAINQYPDSVINIRGRIVNIKDEALGGATIQVKNNNIATITNDHGEFQLYDVPRNAILSISCVNYLTQEVQVNGKPLLELSLDINPGNLQEVVVMNTGYQQISKERFVGSVAVLDSASYSRRAGMDIIGRLDGTVTGVLFDKKRGVGQLKSLQIRGLSTLTNLPQSASSAPLIIVDNFPFTQDLNVLNPNDIESITILKDAAAASIWGAQAGNGVIVITTKKGKYSQPLSITVSSNISIQQKPDLYYYPQMSISDFVDAEIFLFSKGAYDSELGNALSWPLISPVVEMLNYRRAGLIPATDSTEQIDAFKSMDIRRQLDKYYYREAVSQQHHIALSGGNSNIRYNLSVGYNRSVQNLQHTKPNDLLTISSNASFKPLKNLEFTAGINYSQGNNRTTGNVMPSRYVPYAQLADATGSSLTLPYNYRMGYVDTAGAGKLLDWKYRPLDELALSDNNIASRFIQLNAALNYRITRWLNASFNYQYNVNNADRRSYFSQETFFARDLINRFTNPDQQNPDLRNPVPLGDILMRGNQQTRSDNIRIQIGFDKTFGQKHQLKAMSAAEVAETEMHGYQDAFYGYNIEDGSYKNRVDYLPNYPLYGKQASSQIPNNNMVIPSEMIRIVSFLGNFSYTYNGLYSIYASARKDGTNMFGVNTNKKWNPLWSVGASWDLGREDFYNIKWVPSIRFRLSYGVTGNPGNATGLPTITYLPGPVAFTNQTVAEINEAPNPDLKWETVAIFNAGADFNLFGRLTGGFEIFSKKSTDIIARTPFAPSTGITTFVTNVANMKANGFELTLNSSNIQGVFNWETNFGLSYAKSIVTKLYAGSGAFNARQFVSYGQHALEGQIAWGLASYRWAGLDPATGDPKGILNKDLSTDYNAIFNDSVGNQAFHGSAIPLYSGFLKNTFSWKNFSLSANITYRLNFYFRKPALSYSAIAKDWTGLKDYELRWKKPGDEKLTNVPSFTYPLDGNRDLFYQYSEINVLRGDNIRLQDIRLQYTFNKKLIPFFNNFSAFIYLNDLNLILWRKDKSKLDPDFVGGSSPIMPTPKTITLGMSCNF